MKIDWASSYRSDGSRRRPPPSTMHGWLAKMRGTLLGNEKLRSKGMREMREAQVYHKQRRTVGRGRSIFGFFGNRKKSANNPSRVTRRGNRTHKPNTLARPPHSRQSSRMNANRSSGTQRPSMTPRASHASRANHSRPQYTSRRSGRR